MNKRNTNYEEMKGGSIYEWVYDWCNDCIANGDDYYIDENGEMQKSCYDCPFFNKIVNEGNELSQ